MLKIKILSVGKTKEDWLKDALNEYQKRLSKTVEIQWVLSKNDDQLLTLANEEKKMICLDPNGLSLTSEEFSTLLHNRITAQGSKVTFLIGGAEGIPEEIKLRNELLSFSKLTFTHQLCRLILVEQIYRAFQIAKGSTYHK